MRRILITGGNGFVAPHLAEAAREAFDPLDQIILADRHVRANKAMTFPRIVLDVSDRESVNEAIRDLQPTHIAHLAGVSSLSSANAEPDVAWRVNVHGTLNIANAVLAHAPHCTLQFAGSGQVYGDTARIGRALREDDLLRPTSEYGVTKAAADLALGAMAQRGLKAVRFRPFNHTGPGQTEDFVLPNFAAQVARIEAGLAEPIIKVGNLEAKRDFLDVRDVAEAYVTAMLRSETLEPGEILNIASGEAHRIADLLDSLIRMSAVNISVQIDSSRMRAAEIPEFYGDASRITSRIKWRPRRTISELLKDLLAEARAKNPARS